jgi:hypothetical protein
MAVGIAAIVLALGFVLGLNAGRIEGIATSVAQSFGLVGAMDADAAIAAYQNGDYARALRLARPLAETGDAQAQYNLGLSYARGEGTETDDVSAHMWFNLAAAGFPAFDSRNRAAVTRSRDAIASRMSNEQIAEAQRLAREWKPQ